MLSGICPPIAQTLVQLQVDLTKITTVRNLEQALETCLRRRIRPPIMATSDRPPSSPPATERVRLECSADAAVAASLVLRFGLAHGLVRHRAAELALAASELATNVIKYGGGGEIHIALEPGPGRAAIVVTALDRGDGPPSPEELFADGVSRGAPRLPDHAISTGRGTGGGALRRLCDEVEIAPREGGGTRIQCRKLVLS